MAQGAGCDSAVFPVPIAALTQWFVCGAVTSLNELIQMENNPSKNKIFTAYCPGFVPALSPAGLPAQLGAAHWSEGAQLPGASLPLNS